MDKSVLMLLFLGCFPLVTFQVLDLLCRRCDDYIFGRCRTMYTTCNAKNGEVCRHYRMFNVENMSYIHLGYSDCSDRCYPYYRSEPDSSHLLFCCDNHNLCNDDTVPVDHYIKKLSEINQN